MDIRPLFDAPFLDEALGIVADVGVIDRTEDGITSHLVIGRTDDIPTKLGATNAPLLCRAMAILAVRSDFGIAGRVTHVDPRMPCPIADGPDSVLLVTQAAHDWYRRIFGYLDFARALERARAFGLVVLPHFPAYRVPGLRVESRCSGTDGDVVPISTLWYNIALYTPDGKRTLQFRAKRSAVRTEFLSTH